MCFDGGAGAEGWQNLSVSAEGHLAIQHATQEATPLGRLAAPAEIASAALFLAFDESSYVNGTELFVDVGSAQI